MKISELGGEFALIDRIARNPRNSAVVKGIGDDCAIESLGDKMRLYTTDMLVENDHFSLQYFSPYDIGWKAMISNVSDIAACGGSVLYGLLSIALTEQCDVSFVDGFYDGVYDAVSRFGFDLIGGDTTHGTHMSIAVTLIGEAENKNVRLRSAACPGDLIVTSSPLGGSTAGLRLLLKGIPGFAKVKRYHLHPECGVDLLGAILPVSHAMTDVSDGLASEVRNIARESGLCAKLYRNTIPLCDGAAEAAAVLGDDPYDYALFGGEDFALVYTVSADANNIVGTVVGEITEGDGVYLDGIKLSHFGYDHFAENTDAKN